MISSSNVSFGTKDGSDSDKLQEVILEQEEWSQNTGKVTKANLVRYLVGVLQRGQGGQVEMLPPKAVCGNSEAGSNTVSVLIHVYVVDPSMVFVIEATHGILIPKTSGPRPVTEILSFSGSDNADFRYPCFALMSYSWQSRVYDTQRQVSTPQVVKQTSRKLTVSEPVYGILKTKFLTYRHTYELRVPKRELAEENAYDSVVYAYYKGGVTWLTVEMPESSEYEKTNEKPCGYNYGTTRIKTVDGSYLPEHPSDPTTKETTIDYCSQKIISVVVG